MKEKEYIYFRESLIQSVLSDITTFGFLFSGLLLNRFVLYGRWYVDAFFLLSMLLIASDKSKLKRFANKQDLKDYVEKL